MVSAAGYVAPRNLPVKLTGKLGMKDKSYALVQQNAQMQKYESTQPISQLTATDASTVRAQF